MRTQSNDPSTTSHPVPPPPPPPPGRVDEKGYHLPRSLREDRRDEGKRRALELLDRREKLAKGGMAGGGGPGMTPEERRSVEANWLKAPEVAKRLNLEVKFVYRLIKSGRLPATNFSKRLWRVREDHLLRFIGERSRVSLDEVEAQWREEESRSREEPAAKPPKR